MRKVWVVTRSGMPSGESDHREVTITRQDLDDGGMREYLTDETWDSMEPDGNWLYGPHTEAFKSLRLACKRAAYWVGQSGEIISMSRFNGAIESVVRDMAERMHQTKV